MNSLFNDFEFKAAFDLVQKTRNSYIRRSAVQINGIEDFQKAHNYNRSARCGCFIKNYSSLTDKWEKIGKTPIDSMKFPCFTYYQVKFAKEGYDTLLAAMATPFGISGIKTDTFSRKLFMKGTLPAGMVYVEGYWDEVSNRFIKECGFFIDRYEVTNRQYKDFMDKGGYRNPAYWKNEFIKEGRILTLDEALSLFVDKTGRPGPSTWEAGDYPEGQEDYPVSGISWYEAAAYAEFAGKSLPTADHWDSGAGFWYSMFYKHIGPQIIPISNFNGKGPVPVGKQQGITPYGAYDLAGNVREWCWNETGKGHIISGGGYDDASYLYRQWSQLPSFDRSAPEWFSLCFIY